MKEETNMIEDIVEDRMTTKEKIILTIVVIATISFPLFVHLTNKI